MLPLSILKGSIACSRHALRGRRATLHRMLFRLCRHLSQDAVVLQCGLCRVKLVKVTVSPQPAAGIPCELLQHWDPAQPLLVGGLGAAEEGRGFLQLRLKRHRWFGKLLKNRDPLTFSVGWRRFQSMPVYATEDANGRHRCVPTHSSILHDDAACDILLSMTQSQL